MVKVLSSGSSNRNFGSNRRLKKDKTKVSQTGRNIKVSKHPTTPVLQGLWIVATPIGNAGDIGHRAIDVLANSDLIACEDTRVTAKLLSIYEIQTPTIPYHEHNARKQLPRLLKRLENNEAIALVCDAGTPLISDPGYRLVQACINTNITVTSIPGPSALLAALVVSGLPTDKFFFQGFLSSKKSLRRAQLRKLTEIPGSLVFFESVKRLAAMLSDAIEELGDRDATICRELTKKFEEINRGKLSQLATHYKKIPTQKGEVSVVIGPATTERKFSDEDLDQMLKKALQKFSIRDASSDIAKVTGLARRSIYSRAIALRRKHQ